MVSDTLADAVLAMDRYVRDYPDFYAKDAADRIANMRHAMVTISVELDGGAACAMRGIELTKQQAHNAKAVLARITRGTAVAPCDGRALKRGEQRGPKARSVKRT